MKTNTGVTAPPPSSLERAHGRILRAGAITAAAALLAKIASIGRQSLIAWAFGRSDALDAFLIAAVVPEFLQNLIINSFGPAFTPAFISVREQHGEEAATTMLASLGLASAMILAGLGAALALAARTVLPWISVGFTPPEQRLAERLLAWLGLYVALGGLAGVGCAVLTTLESFALPATLPTLTTLAVVAFTAAGARTWGTFAVAAGYIVGSCAQVIWIGIELQRRLPALRWRWRGATPGVRAVAREMLPMMAAAGLMGGTVLVDQIMAARLPHGSVSALSYGNRLISAIVGVAALAIGTAVLPYFSALAAQENWADLRNLVKRYVAIIFGATAPAALLVIAISRPLVRLMYQHGRFHAADTLVVAKVQSALLLQIPFYMVGILLVRLISSLRGNRFLLAISAVALPADIWLNWVLMQRDGVIGIALATSLMYAINCACLLWVAWHLLAGRSGANGQPPTVANRPGGSPSAAHRNASEPLGAPPQGDGKQTGAAAPRQPLFFRDRQSEKHQNHAQASRTSSTQARRRTRRCKKHEPNRKQPKGDPRNSRRRSARARNGRANTRSANRTDPTAARRRLTSRRKAIR